MSLRFTALITALLIAAGGAQAGEIQLRSSAVIDDPVVTLGDLLIGAGDAADVVVARAPAPGRRMVIGVRQIYKAARANGLVWRPLGGLDRVIVRRASKRIGHAEIASRLRKAINKISPREKLSVELPNRTAEIDLPTDAVATLDVENLDYRRESGRFSATLVAAAGTPYVTRLNVVGRVRAMVEMPVLRRAVLRGEIINEDDIAWTELPADRVRTNYITDSADLVGMSPRRTLRPDRPVRSNDVHAPVAVAKGANVVMTFRTAFMVLTAAGRALEDGALGATIRVLNTRSNMVIDALVEGSNLVSVTTRQNIALN
ncbi:MAG: flagellar basal body P-ring formation chaperone FlgA [Alphaproteobacteria bacterium]